MVHSRSGVCVCVCVCVCVYLYFFVFVAYRAYIGGTSVCAMAWSHQYVVCVCVPLCVCVRLPVSPPSHSSLLQALPRVCVCVCVYVCVCVCHSLVLENSTVHQLLYQCLLTSTPLYLIRRVLLHFTVVTRTPERRHTHVHTHVTTEHMWLQHVHSGAGRSQNNTCSCTNAGEKTKQYMTHSAHM